MNQMCRRQHHASIHGSAGAITIAVQFASKHGIAKSRCCYAPAPPQIRNAACRHDHRRTSQDFRRQLDAFTHPPASPRSPFNSHRNATSPERYKGNTANWAQRDCFFQIPEHPMLPQQQPVSSNSASYVLSVSCLFLCGPLRRISVNARFYVQCCLVL